MKWLESMLQQHVPGVDLSAGPNVPEPSPPSNNQSLPDAQLMLPPALMENTQDKIA